MVQIACPRCLTPNRVPAERLGTSGVLDAGALVQWAA